MEELKRHVREMVAELRFMGMSHEELLQLLEEGEGDVK